MARKFQNGDVVALSDPTSVWQRHFQDRTVTVTDYRQGDDHPYVLSNGVLGKATELVKVESLPQAEEELDTSEFPAPVQTAKPIVKIDYFKEAYKLLDLSVGDVIKPKFVLTQEQAINLGGAPVITNWLGSSRTQTELTKYLEQELTVTQAISDGYICFQKEDENTDCFPMIGIDLVKRAVIVAKFQASSDREAVVTTLNVIIDDMIFTFEFFDKLWAYIKEHQKNPKSGDGLYYPICKKHGKGLLRRESIKVGCQTFQYNDVKRLMAAIRVARSTK